jgi:hypothetical protein
LVCPPKGFLFERRILTAAEGLRQVAITAAWPVVSHDLNLQHGECLLLAQSGHFALAIESPLLSGKADIDEGTF